MYILYLFITFAAPFPPCNQVSILSPIGRHSKDTQCICFIFNYIVISLAMAIQSIFLSKAGFNNMNKGYIDIALKKNFMLSFKVQRFHWLNEKVFILHVHEYCNFCLPCSLFLYQHYISGSSGYATGYFPL